MSQGIIRARGTEKPGNEFGDPKGSVTCNVCGAKYDVYHHYAHSENAEEQGVWLGGILEQEHRQSEEHRDEYQYPF